MGANGVARLSARQNEDAEHIASLARQSARLEPVLLFGNRGCGKRSIARRVAQILNLDFDSVSIADNRMETVLFGNEDDAARARDEGPAPGLLGSARSTLLYLSEVQRVDPALGNKLRISLREGYYTDALGARWFLDGRVLLVGSFLEGDHAASILLDSFIVSGFAWKMKIETPAGDDLAMIMEQMWENLCPGLECPPELRTLLRYVQTAPGHLTSLREWVAVAAGALRRSEDISTNGIANIPIMDLQYAMSGITYSGKSFNMTSFRKWLQQFPEPSRPLLLDIVRQIGIRYYVSEDKYFRLLRECVQQSRIAARSRVSFMTFEPLGKSNPLVAHQLKTYGGWEPQTELRLDDPRSWPTFDRDPEWLVLADDFTGTGRKLGKLVPVLPRLFAKYPRSKLRVIVIIAFKAALLKLDEALRKWGEQAALVPGEVLDESDTCFSDSSQIVCSDVARTLLRDTCTQVAMSHFSGLLENDNHLGYGGLGGITVLSYSVPNNSLPILWFDRVSSWQPLFPRSGWR
jgi:hypothetical protein